LQKAESAKNSQFVHERIFKAKQKRGKMAAKKMNIRSLQKDIRKALGASITKKDEIALGILCNTVKMYNECVESIETYGLIVKEKRWVGKNCNEISKANPHVQLSISLQTQIQTLLKEFNMTPRSRKEVGEKPANGEEGKKIKEAKEKIKEAKATAGSKLTEVEI
jgi:P27 family predicted phage terminase small subunit